ncbi:MAG TPA: nitroreductase family protein [Deltaproteobacteria bacterium]|nr:nitroreductase family protein [Deltaproteobacteria bacterium]HQB39325.1 nitroreductase family protein [Deltaproteobacteria bacterium]
MLELLRKRRSIRMFTAEEVAPETVDLMLEALLRAPTSRGNNPWEFIVVDDRELIGKMSAAKEHGSEFVANAPLAVVICADDSKSDVWVEDCSIAAITLQYVACSLGLGSCWAQVRNRRHDADMSAEEYLRKALGLPESIRVECMIAIGYPAESPAPLPASRLAYEKVRRNVWDG